MSSIESSSSYALTNDSTIGILVPNRVFVGGMSTRTTERELRDIFSNYGNVLNVRIVVDSSGSSRGYGFVTFDSEEEALTSLEELGNLVLDERKLNVGRALRRRTFSNIQEENSSYKDIPNKEFSMSYDAYPFYPGGDRTINFSYVYHAEEGESMINPIPYDHARREPIINLFAHGYHVGGELNLNQCSHEYHAKGVPILLNNISSEYNDVGELLIDQFEHEYPDKRVPILNNIPYEYNGVEDPIIDQFSHEYPAKIVPNLNNNICEYNGVEEPNMNQFYHEYYSRGETMMPNQIHHEYHPGGGSILDHNPYEYQSGGETMLNQIPYKFHPVPTYYLPQEIPCINSQAALPVCFSPGQFFEPTATPQILIKQPARITILGHPIFHIFLYKITLRVNINQ